MVFAKQNWISIWCVWLWCCVPQFLAGQTEKPLAIRGTPRIIHYTKKDFQGDPQFWTMAQDKTGVLYFGNNDGALIYNGETWQRISLPNNSSIRSLKVSASGVVYAGGFNEFGTIQRDAYGKYYYESMISLLRQEDRSIENVWAIHEVQGYIVFRSYKMLIAVANNKAMTLPTAPICDFSAVLREQLYIKDGEGLKHVDLNSLEVKPMLTGKENPQDIIALFPGSTINEYLIAAKSGSFYHVDQLTGKTTVWQKLLPANSNDILTCAIQSVNGNYYIGTLRNKVISLTRNGEKVETNVAFNTIQDNTVLNLFESKEGNVWVLLNNGIDCIDLSSPVSLVFEDASVYDVLIDRKKLYMATNQGVFASSVENGVEGISTRNFHNIGGLEGQAWSLQFFEDKVLCSHDRGLFYVHDNSYDRIEGIRGVWKVIPVKGKPHHYLACTYDGIYLLTYDPAGRFKIQHKLGGFIESSRDILQSNEPGVFWVCHGYKGVFRIKIDQEFKRVVGVEHFKDQNGLPSPFNVNVFRWNNEIVFTTNAGIYTYAEADNKFKVHDRLTGLFGKQKNVRKIMQHKDRTWFIHDNEAGYFMTNEETPVMHKDFFLQLKGTFNPSMECIVPVGDELVMMGTNTGLYVFDLAYNADRFLVETGISGVQYMSGQERVFSPLEAGNENVQQLPNNTNSIRFDFSAPAFQDKMNIQYSYWLEGAEQLWSEWQESSMKEYSLLRPGRYTFHVKARSLLGERAKETSYHFKVLPAWYQTRWAYVAYTVIGALLLTMIVSLVKRRFRKEREKTLSEEKEKRKVLELELERIKLSREKDQIMKDKDLLEEDVIYKSKELANYTMLLVKKRELLSVMHEELKELKETVRNDASRQIVRDLMKRININLQDEEYIKVFEANFERVHHEFFSQLKSTFPDLSAKELQLCAFVRMNLTNKEIASILNISVRGVETARYRLRKRLGMSQEEDMGHFLEKLYSSHDASIEE